MVAYQLHIPIRVFDAFTAVSKNGVHSSVVQEHLLAIVRLNYSLLSVGVDDLSDTISVDHFHLATTRKRK